jgi:hypothetical protein
MLNSLPRTSSKVMDFMGSSNSTFCRCKQAFPWNWQEAPYPLNYLRINGTRLISYYKTNLGEPRLQARLNERSQGESWSSMSSRRISRFMGLLNSFVLCIYKSSPCHVALLAKWKRISRSSPCFSRHILLVRPLYPAIIPLQSLSKSVLLVPFSLSAKTSFAWPVVTHLAYFALSHVLHQSTSLIHLSGIAHTSLSLPTFQQLATMPRGFVTWASSLDQRFSRSYHWNASI